LALAVVAVVVAGQEGRVHVDRVSDGLAEAVAGEGHFGGFFFFRTGDKLGGRVGLLSGWAGTYFFAGGSGWMGWDGWMDGLAMFGFGWRREARCSA